MSRSKDRNPPLAEKLRAASAGGFTVIELLVASTIGAMLLIGIRGFFQTASMVVRRAEAETRGHETVVRLADHLSGALKAIVALPGRPALRGRAGSDGTFVLELTISSVGFAPLESREYRFHAPGGDSKVVPSVELRRLRLAGSRSIEPKGDPDAEFPPWETIPGTTISRGATVTFSFHTPQAGWQDAYEGPTGNVDIRVIVVIGKHTLTRRVRPPVNEVLIPE